jgi:hypothetical protein
MKITLDKLTEIIYNVNRTELAVISICPDIMLTHYVGAFL